MVESSALLKRHTPKGYRGFESPPLRAPFARYDTGFPARDRNIASECTLRAKERAPRVGHISPRARERTPALVCTRRSPVCLAVAGASRLRGLPARVISEIVHQLRGEAAGKFVSAGRPDQRAGRACHPDSAARAPSFLIHSSSTPERHHPPTPQAPPRHLARATRAFTALGLSVASKIGSASAARAMASA